MNGAIASSYASLYVDLCREIIGSTPKGFRINIVDKRSDRFAGIVRNAELMGVSPASFLRGVVDQIKFKSINPVHVLSVGERIGLGLYRDYARRVEHEIMVCEADVRYESQRNFSDEAKTELKMFRATMERHVSRLYRGPFEQAWLRFITTKGFWRIMDAMDAQGVVPASFKFLWAPWESSGRSLPVVPINYVLEISSEKSLTYAKSLFPC